MPKIVTFTDAQLGVQRIPEPFVNNETGEEGTGYVLRIVDPGDGTVYQLPMDPELSKMIRDALSGVEIATSMPADAMPPALIAKLREEGR